MTSTFGDLGSAVVIIFIFSILHLVIAISIGISNIKNNWEYYKCNPAIIPFASVFGHDVGTNFNECVQRTQVNFMSSFLDPIYQSLSYFAQNGGVFADMFEKLKLHGNNQNDSMNEFSIDGAGRLWKLSEGANLIFNEINNTFSTLTSSVVAIENVITSVLVGGRSAWNELPGTFIRLATG